MPRWVRGTPPEHACLSHTPGTAPHGESRLAHTTRALPRPLIRRRQAPSLRALRPHITRPCLHPAPPATRPCLTLRQRARWPRPLSSSACLRAARDASLHASPRCARCGPSLLHVAGPASSRNETSGRPIAHQAGLPSDPEDEAAPDIAWPSSGASGRPAGGQRRSSTRLAAYIPNFPLQECAGHHAIINSPLVPGREPSRRDRLSAPHKRPEPLSRDGASKRWSPQQTAWQPIVWVRATGCNSLWAALLTRLRGRSDFASAAQRSASASALAASCALPRAKHQSGLAGLRRSGVVVSGSGQSNTRI